MTFFTNQRTIISQKNWLVVNAAGALCAHRASSSADAAIAALALSHVVCHHLWRMIMWMMQQIFIQSVMICKRSQLLTKEAAKPIPCICINITNTRVMTNDK